MAIYVDGVFHGHISGYGCDHSVGKLIFVEYGFSGV